MGKRLSNILMVVVSVVLCTAAAEFFVRQIDDSTDNSPGARHLDEIALAPGVERAWYFADPPPLHRQPISKEWSDLLRRVEDSGATEGTRRADMFKAWNANFVGDPCKHSYLSSVPGHLYVYDPPSGGVRPPYRFMPDATTPIGLVTNQYGFRGPPVPFARQPRTVRIAFVGASTTVGSHHFPFAYPEFVGNWLNMWAAAHKLGVTFEILNSGRESITSSDNVVIVRDEVLPLRPDLIVYYEGANQFFLNTVVPTQTKGGFVFAPQKEHASNWWDDVVASSALLRRFKALLSSGAVPAGGGEWPKPDYKLVWPKDVDEKDPDITRPDLPVTLSTILGDLNAIRAESSAVGAEFVLASFIWLVKDGMILDPIRHRSILEYLNQGYAPYRYKDMERLAAFQNRVFAKYAQANKLPFIDVARRMPFDPDLYVDAIHNSYSGERLRAWVFLQGLVPIVESHLKSGAWPRTDIAQDRQPPAFKPRSIDFSCPARSG